MGKLLEVLKEALNDLNESTMSDISGDIEEIIMDLNDEKGGDDFSFDYKKKVILFKGKPTKSAKSQQKAIDKIYKDNNLR